MYVEMQSYQKLMFDITMPTKTLYINSTILSPNEIKQDQKCNYLMVNIHAKVIFPHPNQLWALQANQNILIQLRWLTLLLFWPTAKWKITSMSDWRDGCSVELDAFLFLNKSFWVKCCWHLNAIYSIKGDIVCNFFEFA